MEFASAEFHKDSTGALKGIAFVECGSLSAATHAFEAINGTELLTRKMRVEYKKREETKEGGGPPTAAAPPPPSPVFASSPPRAPSPNPFNNNGNGNSNGNQRTRRSSSDASDTQDMRTNQEGEVPEVRFIRK